MENFQNRVDSFSQSARVKTGAKSTTTLKWPHPTESDFLATPLLLADAGFYYDPSAEDPDSTTCYMCGKQLSEWSKDDNPFEIHYSKCAKTCSWAFLRCGLWEDLDEKHQRFVSKDKNRHPTSKAMEKARLETFIDWKHDAVKNCTFSSKKMAQAGFIHSPGDDVDGAVCLYCGTSLSGWEEGDIPLDEHRKRVQKSKNEYCAFLDDPPPKALARSTSRSASKSNSVDTVMATKTFDGAESSDEPAAPLVRTAKTPRARKTTRAATETEDEEITAPPRTTRKPSSRARSASRAPSADEDATPAPSRTRKPSTRSRAPSVDERETAPSRAHSRSQSKSKPIPETEEEAEEDEDEVPDLAPRPTKHSRSKSKAKADENEAPPATRTRKTSTRSKKAVEDVDPPSTRGALARSRSAKPESSAKGKKAVVSEDEEPEEPRPVKKAAAKSKPASKSKAVTSDVSDVDVVSKAPAPGRTRASKAKPSPPLDYEDEEDFITSPPVVSKPASKKPSTKSRAKAKVEVESSEPEEPLAPPPPPKKSTRKGKAKDDSDPIPPPATHQRKASRSQAKHLADETVTSMGPSGSQANPSHGGADELTPVPLTKKAGVASLGHGKPPPSKKQEKPSVIVVDESNDEDVFMDAVEEQPASRPASRMASQPKPKPKSSKKPSPPLPGPIEVDLSSDGEEEIPTVKLVPKAKTKPVEPHRPKTPSPIPTPAPMSEEKPVSEEKPLPSEDKPRSNVGKLATKFEFPKKVSAPQPFRTQTPPPRPPRSPERPRSPVRPSPLQADADMEEYVPEPEVDAAADQSMEYVETQPVTPPRRSPIPSPTLPASNAIAPSLPQPSFDFNIDAFIPALATEPFAPMEALTEAELSMSVEEWIRFHMHLECDKFARDGEREVLSFERRAQEVQRTLEAL